MRIKIIKGKKILNSAGHWTVACYLQLSDGREGEAAVPQGISAGREEKKSVALKKALFQLENEIGPQLKKLTAPDQFTVDQVLQQEERWGGNATLAASAAFAKASGFFSLPSKPKPPFLMVLIFEGKKHGSETIKIQEFMVVKKTVEEGVETYQRIKSVLEKRKILTTVGSEGGFSPPSLTDKEILSLLKEEKENKIALDVAASHTSLSPTQLLQIVRRYPIFSLEDPLPENLPSQWKKFSSQLKEVNPKTLIIADDLTVTDQEKIRRWGREGLFDGVIIKPNQQGTITQTVEAIKEAKKQGLKTIVSHRGEETNDSWIVDLALKEEVDGVKLGAPVRGERVAKYNRLKELLQK